MAQIRIEWPSGDGEMATRIRDLDWAATSLGAISRWSERLHVMVELLLASPLVSSLVCGPERVLIYNDAAAKLYGDRHPAALGRSLPEAFPEGWATVAPFYERAFAGETVQVVGQPLDTRGEGDATDVFDALLIPVHETDGRVAFVHMMGSEIGARARVEATLRESEARQSLLIGSWAQAVWETDAEGIVVADSPSWRAFTGQTLEEWLGYGWLDAIHPDDRGYAERQWREAIAARGLVNAEFRLQAPDGGWRWTNIRAAPVLNARGGIEKWAGMNIDIDARKRSEAALRESEELRRIAVTGAGMGTWRWNLRDEHIWGDALFMNLWGFPASEEPRRLPDFTARMSQQGQAEMGEMVSHALAAGEEFDGQLAVVDGPTKGRWVRWRGRAEQERPWIVNGVSFDVTEQRLAEERLRASEERQSFLLKLSDVLRGETDERHIERIALDQLAEQLSVDRAYITMSDYDKGETVVPAEVRRGELPPLIGIFRHSDFPESARLVNEGTLVVEDVGKDAQLSDLNRRSFEAVRIGALIGVGLRKGVSDIFWTLAVATREPRKWTLGEVRLLEDVAERVQAALARASIEAALRESEERLRVLIEGMPQLVWRAVEAGHWTWTSPQWTTFTGQGEADSYGWGWLDPVHPDDREGARAAWGLAVEADAFRADYRIYQASEQRYRWFQTRATPVRDEAGAIAEWLGTSTDIDDVRALQVRLEVLVKELQHRSRNLIGVVTALSNRTIGRGSPVESFTTRLKALSRAQALLSQSGSDTVEVEALVRAELAAHTDGASSRITVDGPVVLLTSQQVQNFALALHELTTNAVKYGALKEEAGRLAITWEVIQAAESEHLALDWIETGVDLQPEAVTRRGYGRELIERALAYALGGRTDYTLAAGGVRCRIELPLT